MSTEIAEEDPAIKRDDPFWRRHMEIWMDKHSISNAQREQMKTHIETVSDAIFAKVMDEGWIWYWNAYYAKIPMEMKR